MGRLILAVAAMLVSGLSAGCVMGEQCDSTFKYDVEFDVPQATYTSCEVDFDAGHNVARYTSPDPCADTTFVEAAAQGDSPPPDGGSVSQCAFPMAFDVHARALAKYLGKNTFTATLSCDGKELETKTIKPTTRECRL